MPEIYHNFYTLYLVTCMEQHVFIRNLKMFWHVSSFEFKPQLREKGPGIVKLNKHNWKICWHQTTIWHKNILRMFYNILRGKEKFPKQMRSEYSYSGSYSEMVTHCFQPRSLHGLSPVLFVLTVKTIKDTWNSRRGWIMNLFHLVSQ